MTDNSYLLSLFGTSMPSSTPTMSGLAAFQQYIKNEPAQIAKYAAQPTTETAVDYFKAQIKKITNVNQLTSDPKLLSFLTTAFGIDADAQYPAKVLSVINSNLSDTSSFANSLIDPRYKAMATELNVQATGLTTVQSDSTIDDIVNKYLTNSYEESLDNINPELRSAAYFVRNVGSITDTYSILGDSVLRSVVTSTLNLPPEIANQDVTTQKSLIDSKIDITQFETTTPSAASTATTPLGEAQTDQSSLADATAANTAAQTAVQSVADSIQSIQDDYARLANIQDPNGYYAAEIPIQEAAAPQLVRQQGLLTAAQTATGNISDDLNQMSQLIQQAGDPTNAASLSDYQSEFDALRSKISGEVSGANYAYDNGTSGATFTDNNLLDGSMSSSLSVQYDSAGDATSVRTYDLSATSSFQSALDAADAAFQAATGSGDGTNLSNAATALATATTAANNVSQSVAVDADRFANDIASVPQWAGTLNTAALYPGAAAVSDAGSRITSINQLLTQIQGVATQSNQLGADADRTSLTAQYSDLLTQLGTLINTPNSPVDNLLAGGPDTSYALTDTSSIQAHVQDLNSSVLDVLNAGDISTSDDAGKVLVQLNGAISDAMGTAASQIGQDGQVFSLAANTLDPRAAADSAYRQLATSMANTVTGAATSDANLLDPDQDPISLSLGSVGQFFSIDPISNFNSDVTQAITNGANLLPSDTADTSGALAALNNAQFNVQEVQEQLDSNAAQLSFATSLVGQKVNDLNTKAAATTTGEPINATAATYQFVQKYLALQDAQAASSSSSGGGQSYLLPLFTTSA